MTLQEEKEKAQFEHTLELKRILIEKVLLGVLIGIAVLGANFLLERFKSDLSRERFLLESRMAAIQALRDSYGSLHNHVLHIAQDEPKEAEKRRAAHKAELEKFVMLVNRSSLLFPPGFNDAMAQQVWIHAAISKGAAMNVERWQFLAEVSNCFEEITRLVVTEEALGTRLTGFQLEMWSAEEIDTKGSGAYFDANYEKWQKSRKAQRPEVRSFSLISLAAVLLGLFALSLAVLVDRK